eukprot:TRINITY_DN17866_c2_g1_i1.p1 TRINITY_DN17866_c2_g1~~TRINITY_DN17866_c2_g1_i1.p1  ORF type:complete len:916 (+),score=163.98 TRINITY_DN17866_c2_g1_i1:275-2749(+)
MRNPSPSSKLATLLLLLLCLLISFLSSKAVASSSSTRKSSLNRGSSLSVEEDSDPLTSPDTTFSSGFYQVGSNAYCFSIWFTHSANKSVVWMANRDRPVNGRGSRISLDRDGNMVLTDVDGSVVWNSNTSNSRGQSVELSNNGNLVLKDPDGNFLWQSFDFPTDTLLPSQPITKGKKLISASANGVVSSGYYSFYFDNDNVLKMMYDGPEISSLYWPNPDYNVFQNGRSNYNSSRYGVLDEMGLFVASDQFGFNASDLGLGIKRRLTLDYDGNLRLYSLDESTGLWGISWAAMAVECKVHGLCGRNGICVYAPTLKCSCAVGYEMRDPSDLGKGCKLKINLSCDPNQVKFVALQQIDFYGFDSAYRENISLESCRQLCLNDCSCEAFMYRNGGDGACFAKSALFNGYRSVAFPGTMYLKLPKNVNVSGSSMIKESNPICESSKAERLMGSSDMYKTTHDMKYIYFYWFVSAIGVIEVLFVASGWWYLFRSHGVPTSEEEGYRALYNQFRRFTYAELKKATKKFKEELGRGGSGCVYKGVLDDDRVVAVKKLGDAIQGEEEFLAEMSTIGRIYHMKLVRMWGYCSERSHRLLVYEYVENGSLDKHLFSNSSSGNMPLTFLGWSDRFKIAVGTAKGLAYLHHECLEWVIHCDVKPENILLDSDFEPKIADFGLAKLSQRGGSGSNFSQIRGTKGYMAPEWASNLPITAKVDVYGYGVVLLEIVSGNRLSSRVVDGDVEEVELQRFVRMAKEKLEGGEETWISDFVDVRLNGQFDCRQAEVMVEIGISCVEEDRNKRPTMDMVVQTLLACDDESHDMHHSKSRESNI